VSDNAAQFLFQPDKGEQPWGFAEFNENINVADYPPNGPVPCGIRALISEEPVSPP